MREASNAGQRALRGRGVWVWMTLAFVWLLVCMTAAMLQPPSPVTDSSAYHASGMTASGFWYPIERNAYRRLPRIHAELLAMRSDGRRGWAVGNHGGVIATADGGNTWHV